MDSDSQLLADRISDLEDQIVSLNEEIDRVEKEKNKSKKCLKTSYIILLPLIGFALVLLGLDIQYQSEQKHIRYNNDSLVELGLSAITVASGIYTIKKSREQTKRRRD